MSARRKGTLEALALTAVDVEHALRVQQALSVADTLQQNGVNAARIENLLKRCRCDNVQDLSVFLRFQLPPFEFSNATAVEQEVDELFGINRSEKARQLLRGLGITRTIDKSVAACGPEEPIDLSLSLSLPDSEALHQTLDPHDSSAPPAADVKWNVNEFVFETARSDDATLLGRVPSSAAPSGTLQVTSLHSHQSLTATGATTRLPPASAHCATPEAEADATLPWSAKTGRSQPRTGFNATGQITASTALDTGPIHEANKSLRRMLPHVQAHVTISVDWVLLFLLIANCATLLAYTGLRLYQLVTGQTGQQTGGNISIVYSWFALVCETAVGLTGMYSRMLTLRQHVRFSPLDDAAADSLRQKVAEEGTSQMVYVLVATYSEPATLVRECVLRLLAAPEPLDMEKLIIICDDGHALEEGARKKALVDALNAMGHYNVMYVGDRVKRGQLNGKSSNLNHAILTKIYPHTRCAGDVPAKDILMVMDCDHMVKPEIFLRMGACMRDERVGVTLVPQSFHNIITPDFYDASNANFMFNTLPYVFGSGCCFITGTNVMVRARATFRASRFYDEETDALHANDGWPELLSEEEISEDLELGSRMHFAGYKAVFVAENLATGEVPLDARGMWRQRLRWFKGGHLFALNRQSIFYRRSPFVSVYQKLAYCIGPICHAVAIWAEPFIFTLPLFCVVGSICAFGLDRWLFFTHLARFLATIALRVYAISPRYMLAALSAQNGARVQWFTSVKAVLNTILVVCRFKAPPRFKLTKKSVQSGSGETAELECQPLSPSATATDESAATQRPRRKRAHEALSQVTEKRRVWMPLDGTLDVWVLAAITGVNFFAAVGGTTMLIRLGAFKPWDGGLENVLWLGVVFAYVDVVPGALFFGYMAVYDLSPGLLKVWVPLVITLAALLTAAAELRVLLGFTLGI